MSSIKHTFANGVLIDINVSKWSGWKRLTPEDLGLKAETVSKAYKLGEKALIDPEILRHISNLDAKSRNLLMKMSYEFPFQFARFVPKKALVKFDEEFNKIKQEFDKAVEDICTNYDKYKLKMRQYFLDAAKAAHTRLITIPEYKDLDKDTFINHFLTRIEDSYPSKENIRSKYSMTYVPFQMELPDLCQASINDVKEETEKIKIIEDSFHRKISKALDEYASTIANENRARVQSVLDAVSGSLTKKNGRLTKATLESINNMVDTFKLLNISNDHSVELALSNFQLKYLSGNDYTTQANYIAKTKSVREEFLRDVLFIGELLKNTTNINAIKQAYEEKLKTAA